MGKLTDSPSPSLYRRIIYAYDDLGSVKSTAEACGASEVTVRRVLITEGLWSSRVSVKVEELRQQGKSVQEIASELCVSVKAVEAYLPYSRGMYGQEPTDDSVRSKEYRERVSDAQKGVRSLKGEHYPEAGSEAELGPGHELKPEAERVPAAKPEPEREPEEKPGQEIPKVSEESGPDSGSGQPEPEKDPVPVLRLHLELTEDPLFARTPGLGLDERELETFLALAKAEKGISRDILVPADMNLHALHYAIQRLFGWRNSHLHRFSLTDADFSEVTGGRFGPYEGLCGALFRFPDDDYSDIYWDDDYDENISIKSWLRRKYRRPYRCGAICDTLYGNRMNVGEFRSHFPEISDQDTLKNIEDKIYFEDELNALSERLSVGELFLPADTEAGDINVWKTDVQDSLSRLESERREWNVDEIQAEISAAELKKWRESQAQLEDIVQQNPKNYRSAVRRQTGYSYEESVKQHKQMINFWEERCDELIFDWEIRLKPRFHDLYYFYDYGDDWCVKITAVEELQDVPEGVNWDDNAVCVAADGLNVTDDCGGIDGYLEMLETIHGTDKDEAESMRNWARMMGWTGRKSTPEKML